MRNCARSWGRGRSVEGMADVCTCYIMLEHPWWGVHLRHTWWVCTYTQHVMHAHHADRQPREFIPYRRMQKASPEAIWNRRSDLGERIAGSCEVFCETSSYGTRALALYRQMMHGRKVLWCPALHPIAFRIVVVIDACPIEPPNTSRMRQKRHTHAPRNSIPWDIALITSEILVKDDKMQREICALFLSPETHAEKCGQKGDGTMSMTCMS